ncbi:hypothetical protein [Kitasatospora sp. GP82]|uniref:hypothetical protein n=1 Tax=Kitasatospora sp. GP82 TaxID=3035089 RepID=UPI0024772184|nr:hypothetical protein [Kitasatospora sp. GP82]MDH6129834.1 hypothetical protein [Kitasatospora sp. GP82]
MISSTSLWARVAPVLLKESTSKDGMLATNTMSSSVALARMVVVRAGASRVRDRDTGSINSSPQVWSVNVPALDGRDVLPSLGARGVVVEGEHPTSRPETLPVCPKNLVRGRVADREAGMWGQTRTRALRLQHRAE